MNYSLYCKQNSEDNYLQLLRFARVTGWSEKDYRDENKNNLLQILKSLPDNKTIIDPILSLVYENSIKTGLYELITSKTQAFLKKNAFRLLAIDMAHRRWLETTLEEFKLKDIPIILLKRSAFANNLYSEAAPRLGVDIDILVKDKDFDAACSILSTSMKPVVLSTKRLATHDTLFERMFNSEDASKPIVEIHRGLTNPYIFTIEESEIWENSREHPAYNSKLVRILSPEDTLLHLAVHAFRDLDFCTHNLLDTHEVWCQWNPDQEILMKRAKVWGARKVLYYLLFNTKAIMKTPIPESLLAKIIPGKLFNILNKYILSSNLFFESDSSQIKHRIFQILSQYSFPDNPIHGFNYQRYYFKLRYIDFLSSLK